MEKNSLLKHKFNLSEGWEISEWQFWRNICLESNFPSKMILKYPTKQTRKIHEAKTAMSEKPDWFLSLLKFPLPQDLVGVSASRAVCHPCQDQAVGSRHIHHIYQATPAPLGHSHGWWQLEKAWVHHWNLLL